MDVRFILATSVLLQFVAAFLAVRLIWVTGAGRAWGLIATAVFLMGVRRSITLFQSIAGDSSVQPDLSAELVALAISALMVAGIAWIAPLFVSVKQSETALRESQRKLSALLGNLPGMAYRCRNDESWTMELVSEGCLALTGYQPADLVGNRTLPYADLIHPDHREMVWDQVQEALTGRRPFHLVYRISPASGKEKWVWEQGSGVFSEQGEVLAIEGFITDITERRQAEEVLQTAHKELEERVRQRTAELTRANRQLTREIVERAQAEEALAESEQWFRSLVETTSDWIWAVDQDGVYTYASPKVKDLLGYEPEEVIGKTPFDFMPSEEAQRVAREFHATVRAAKPVVRLENVNLHKDGHRVVLETSGVPVLDAGGNLRGCRGVDRDITKPKQDEVHLKQTLAELERSNRDLAQFAYSASHDLQEPLRMMGSYLQALQGRLGDRLDPQSQSFIDLSLDASRRMQQLIDGLLAYSRVGTQGKEFQAVDAGAVMDQAVANLQAAIERQGAEVTRDELPTITADPTLMAQLFQNLIGNAVKFRSDEPPRVHVSCKESGREWTFSVRDNGIGIDPKHADRIFDIFERLNAREKYPGTGIGLAICKRVVERHGGRIWCESAPGRGTTFHFTIPRGEAAEQAARLRGKGDGPI